MLPDLPGYSTWPSPVPGKYPHPGVWEMPQKHNFSTLNTTRQVLIRIFTLHCIYVCMGVLHRATQKIKLLTQSLKFMWHMCMLSTYPADRVSCVPQNTQVIFRLSRENGPHMTSRTIPTWCLPPYPRVGYEE